MIPYVLSRFLGLLCSDLLPHSHTNHKSPFHNALVSSSNLRPFHILTTLLDDHTPVLLCPKIHYAYPPYFYSPYRHGLIYYIQFTAEKNEKCYTLL